MTTDNELIQGLAQSPMFRDYQTAFTGATGLPLELRAEGDWNPAFHGSRQENPFCARVASHSRSCAGCLRLQEKLCNAASATHAASTMQCPFGMAEVAVPVMLGQQTLGYLRAGQVLPHEVTKEDLDRVDTLARHLDMPGTQEELHASFRQTPVMPRQKLESATRLLSYFAEQLAAKSNQLAIREANNIPAQVLRAKRFIESNYEEDIALADAARAAHTSVFHLCKLLRKSLGLSFTELLGRQRVEAARHLLANPNLRVSEIAYQVGFQSLTHFNRTFKKVVGISPTRYRDTAGSVGSPAKPAKNTRLMASKPERNLHAA